MASGISSSAAPQTTSITNFITVKLSQDNYTEWEPRISTFLQSRGLLGYVDGTIPCPSADDSFYSHWCRTDELTRSYLFGTLTEPLLGEVQDLPSAKAVWDALLAREQQQEIAHGQQDDESPQLPNKRRLHEVRETENDSEASAVSEYDVFLSFRGPDCLHCLVSVLYRDMTAVGICAFRDNDALETGDKISKILPCINNSKICVPIFSERFAESAWCLREVERMVDLKKPVMPIFYKVTPDDVKLRTDFFETDLQKHVAEYGKDQVKKWKDALKAVGRIIGQEVKSTGLAEFSKSFVSELINKIKVNRQNEG